MRDSFLKHPADRNPLLNSAQLLQRSLQTTVAPVQAVVYDGQVEVVSVRLLNPPALIQYPVQLSILPGRRWTQGFSAFEVFQTYGDEVRS